MNIIIPMSGSGSRFISAGYKDIKPMIEVFGKPMIKHIVEKFSRSDNFIFICRSEHIKNKELKLESYLNNLAENTTVLEVENHKLGPVYSILKAKKHIINSGELIVNYCDFDWRWNYEDFKNWLKIERPDAAICVYTGFHPHYINPSTYAYVRSDQHNLLEIREKQSFTKYREEEAAASGTFYFSSGSLLLDACNWLFEREERINGEFYVSLVYNYFSSENMRVLNYYITHFMQWGTPQDLEEFKFFASKVPLEFKKNSVDCFAITLMAGKGNRLKSIDSVKKPYLTINNEYLFKLCTKNFVSDTLNVLVVNGDDEDKKYLKVTNDYENVSVGVTLSSVETLFKTLEEPIFGLDKPVFVMPCDAAIDMDWSHFLSKTRDAKDCSAVIFSFNGYPYAKWNPDQYGWLEIDDNFLVKSVGLKQGWYEDFSNPIITGYFWFPSLSILKNDLKLFLKEHTGKDVEPSIDQFCKHMISERRKVYSYPVDNFLCLGIPPEFRAYEYWLAANEIRKIK